MSQSLHSITASPVPFILTTDTMVERGRDRDVVLVANELTANNHSALIDGVLDLVIATPTKALAENAVRSMLHAAVQPSTFTASQMMLPFELYGPENI